LLSDKVLDWRLRLEKLWLGKLLYDPIAPFRLVNVWKGPLRYGALEEEGDWGCGFLKMGDKIL
jgi:hypothetical protein